MNETNFVLDDVTLVRPERDRQAVTLVEHASVVVRDGRLDGFENAGTEVLLRIDGGGRLVTPGLVDCHTHAVFAGDRSAEFCARAAGATYLELAQLGGGIRSTVRATRAASTETLVTLARRRLQRLAANGITTVEVKTGYGLSAAEERRLLEVISSLEDATTPRVTATLLAAHAIPPEAESADARAGWVSEIAKGLIPGAIGHADRIDVFVEQTAYTAAETRTLAAAAKAAGLGLHLHVDQITAGQGAQLAAELGATAAAHLERIDPAGIDALAKAGTVAILIPTATLVAREPAFAPARALLNAGVKVALSTNLNPGTAPTESVALTMFLGAVSLGMTPAEIVWAMTRGGAMALGLADCGVIEAGVPADLVLWNATSLAQLPYRAGINLVDTVWREGRVLARGTGTPLDGDV